MKSMSLAILVIISGHGCNNTIEESKITLIPFEGIEICEEYAKIISRANYTRATCKEIDN